jgi:hypothetical protein
LGVKRLYHSLGKLDPRLPPGGFETNGPLAEPLSDPLAGEFQPNQATGGSPFETPLVAPVVPEEGGGGGAEPGGHYGSGGGTAPASSGTSYGASGGLSSAPTGATGAADPAAAPGSFPAGVGLTGPSGRQPTGGKTAAGASSPLSPTAGGAATVNPSLLPNFAKLPTYFEANQGQTDASVQYLACGSGYMAFLRASGPTFELPRGGPANADGTRTLDVVTFQHQGANTAALVTPQGQLTSRANYFTHGSPTLDVPEFTSLRYANFYPNIDLVYHAGSTNPNQAELDYVVHPGVRGAAAFNGKVESNTAKFKVVLR